MDVDESNVAADFEKRLVELEHKHRVLFASTTDAILVYELDSGHILEVNSAAREMFGYTAEEFRARSVRDLHPDGAREDIERIWAQLRDHGQSPVTRLLCCCKDESQRDARVWEGEEAH